MTFTSSAARHLSGVGRTHFAVLLALSFSHLLNDLIQSLIPAIYPLLKESYGLAFMQVGLITLAFLAAAALVGVRSSIFHPEASRMARAMRARGSTRTGSSPSMVVSASNGTPDGQAE